MTDVFGIEMKCTSLLQDAGFEFKLTEIRSFQISSVEMVMFDCSHRIIWIVKMITIMSCMSMAPHFFFFCDSQYTRLSDNVLGFHHLIFPQRSEQSTQLFPWHISNLHVDANVSKHFREQPTKILILRCKYMNQTTIELTAFWDWDLISFTV